MVCAAIEKGSVKMKKSIMIICLFIAGCHTTPPDPRRGWVLIEGEPFQYNEQCWFVGNKIKCEAKRNVDPEGWE